MSAGKFSPEEVDTDLKERIPILVEILIDLFDRNLELSEFKSEIDGQEQAASALGVQRYDYQAS